MGSFTLSLASHTDLPQIVRSYAKSFNDFAVVTFMGIICPSDHEKLAKKYGGTMLRDPADVWLKLQDTSTGAIVTASNWKLYHAPESDQPRERDEPVDWVSHEVAERQRLLIGPMKTAREAANPDLFMCAAYRDLLCAQRSREKLIPLTDLHILATHPDYRRQGIDAMMMQ